MGPEFNQMLDEWRAAGECELDLDFAVDLSRAREHRLTAQACDGGLLALSMAVQNGAQDVYLDGNDRVARFSYEGHSCLLKRGAFSQVLRRGAQAPLRLWVNRQRLISGVPQPITRLPLRQTGQVRGGYVDILRTGQKGQVELVDRGVSFRLGAIFGAVRVVAKVTPQKGAPWPSRLVFDKSLRALLFTLLLEVQDLSQNCRT